MKKSIINRIIDLGGRIGQPNEKNLEDIIASISFKTVLYPKPEVTPWADADDQEPIYGLNDFVEENLELFKVDKKAFYNKIVETFYTLTEESHGQTFWVGKSFTPFKEGSPDFEEWNDLLTDDTMVNFEEVNKIVTDPKSDFIQLFYSYGYPDHIYISSSDPNPENPTVFGTDHEVFFKEIDNLGSLEDYLNTFMTSSELLHIVKTKIADYNLVSIVPLEASLIKTGFKVKPKTGPLSEIKIEPF